MTTNAPATAAERALAARLVAAEELRGPFVCRACALRLVEQLVFLAATEAERDVRNAIQEQMTCPN